MPKKVKRSLFIIIGILFSLVVLFISLYFYFDYRLGMKEVAIAKYSLKNRTLISEEEIEIVKVPKAYLNEEVLISKEDIIGKYVKINTLVPKGSFFYKGALDEFENVKDKLNSELFKDEVNFDISVNNIKVNQAYLTKGMYVDIYLTINTDRVLSDLLINNVRIIGLYDISHQEIKDYDKGSFLQDISLAVNKEALPYLNKAEVIGELSIVVSNDSYKNVDSKLNKKSAIFTYLE